MCTTLLLFNLVFAVSDQNNTFLSFQQTINSDDFKNFEKIYDDKLFECSNNWAIHSPTICRQLMITHYQNQLIIDELKKLNEDK